MAEPILVPQVGQDLTEAKVVALHVKPGDAVARGDVVAEVESEKASFEVEAFVAGVVIEVAYAVGDTATVLEPLMYVGEAGETVGRAAEAPEADTAEAPAAAAPEAAAAEVPVAAPEAGAGVAARSSPVARRVAAANGLDTGAIKGTGPRGAVVLRDVEAAIAAAQATGQATLRAVPQQAGGTGASGLNLRTLRDGVGEPVAFLHGFGSDLSSWRPLAGRLALSNPLVALDLPGHGGSAGCPAAGFAALTDQVAAALAAAGHTRLHLVGHSLGAAVAAALAGRGDLDVRSLTLISPAGLGPGINGDFIAGFLGAASEEGLAAWMRCLVHSPSALPGAMVRATLAARAETGVAAAQGQLAAALFEGSTQLFSVQDAVQGYEGPCRVVVGRDDRIIPGAHAETVPAGVALHRLDGVGHLPQLEAAALVARLVAETVRAAG